LSVIKTSEGMPKMKTAVIASTLALGLGLSGAYAQNANDRPGMTAPQEGTMTQPNQPGSMSNPQRAPQTTGANPGNTKSMDEQAGGNNQAVERNPDGAPIGSKTNPSPR
jgi:Spy/CpxP family protein refolding chaperone